jgi:organic hydroperoxide reductase OsmC/OhrA
MGGGSKATNPEQANSLRLSSSNLCSNNRNHYMQLFAAGYGACFMGAMGAMAPTLKVRFFCTL